MGSFLNAAKRPIMDVASFLKQNSGSSMKYSAVANETHKLYFPYREVVTADGSVKNIIALQANVHDMHVTPEKFESCVCLDGITRMSEDGKTIVNDGTCPFCGRASDAYAIKAYREDLAVKSSNKSGKDLEDYKKALSSQYGAEIKISRAKPKAYVLVAKFNLDANGNPILENGLPTYDLKVMSLTTRRLEEFLSVFTTSGMSLAGGELTIKYPNLKDIRQVVGQSTAIPSFGQAAVIERFPAVVEKIQAEAESYEFDGIENSFPEWKGMSTEQAKIKCNTMFSAWDSYQKELATNPNALYLEYGNSSADMHTNPALTMKSETPDMSGQGQNMGMGMQMPGGMNMGMGNMPNMNMPGQGQGQNMGMGMPGGMNFDANAMFGGNLQI